MNYLNIYKKIINIAKIRKIDIIGENHHIIPKSIFTDNKSHILSDSIILEKNSINNIVKVTIKEHYILHALLVNISKLLNKNCYEKMIYSFNIMSNRTKSSKNFLKLKEQFKRINSEKMLGKPSRAKGCKWSKEAKEKKSNTHPAKGKTYEEYYGEKEANRLKELRKKSLLNRVITEETKRKISQRLITKEWKDKISKANTGKKRTKEQISKLKEFFSNRDKNPIVDQTKYKFYHKNGKELIARKIDMKKDYNCKRIHNLIRGEIKQCNGWLFKGEIIND